MWQRFAAAAALIALAACGAATSTLDEPPLDVASLITVNDANAEAKRAELVAQIWPAGLPTTRPVVGALTVWPSKLAAMTQRPAAATLSFDVDGLTSLGFLLTPTNPNGRYAIVHQGHIPHDTTRYLEAGVAPAADALVAAGWTVAVLQMPMQGWNADHTGAGFNVSGGTHGTGDHKAMATQAGFAAPMLRFFLEPVIEVLNEFDARGATEVLMTGISGGGWTTTIAATVDSRIDVSVPVSGTLPLFARPYSPGSVTTDPEQVYPDSVFGDNGPFGYLNLYALGSDGDRVQVQVINQNDPCCFGGDAHLMYSTILHDTDASWSVYVDESHAAHKISAAAITDVLLTVGEPPPPPVPDCPT